MNRVPFITDIINAVGEAVENVRKSMEAWQKENHDKKEKKEQEERSRKVAEFHENLLSVRHYITEFEKEWRKSISGFVLVDSNIWMNYQYDDLFRSLSQLLISSSGVLEIPAEQFDEIVNLKNLPFDNPKSKRARRALSVIEDFQNKNVLKIVPMGLDTKKGAYADPKILKILIAASKTHSSVTFISDDRELRIRANQLVRDASNGEFRAVGGKEMLDNFIKYENCLKFARSANEPSAERA